MTKQEFEEMAYFKLMGKDPMLVLDFISYWTERDLKGKKMRFQGEKFFCFTRRFATFEKNNRQWNKTEFKTTKSPLKNNDTLNEVLKQYESDSQ